MKTTPKATFSALGVQKDEPIELTDEVLYWIIKAICGVENGNDYYYPRELIEQAIKLARS